MGPRGGTIAYGTFGWWVPPWGRASYGAGGAALAVYEVHMRWEIGVVALALVTVPVWRALNAPPAVAASKGGDEHG
ncbi:MAG: hypothetical protein K6V97_01205 [Actinomycetia bacterium]|nr:hypothetical protein [Actinomycetes bacterium]